MKFFAIAAALIGAVAAQSSSCAVVTITVTQTIPVSVHTPVAPSTAYSVAPYPTGPVVPSIKPTGTGAPSASGTGAYSTSAPQFTGAASSLQMGGFVAGVGAFAAFLL